MAKQELTCDDILKELRAKQYRPIYYLMGEESIQGLLEEYVGHSNRVKLTPEIQEAFEKAQAE